MNSVMAHMTPEASREIGIAIAIFGIAVIIVIALLIAAMAKLINWANRSQQKRSNDSPDHSDARSNDMHGE